MTRVYYREAVGALVVFDVTRASTFDAVLKWKDDLDSKVRQQLSELHVWLTLEPRPSFCPLFSVILSVSVKDDTTTFKVTFRQIYRLSGQIC